MTLEEMQARQRTLEKLGRSRAELRLLLEPPTAAHGSPAAAGAADGAFPRSRTMRLLLSGKGLGVVGALLGLMLSRPAPALRLLRLLPVGRITLLALRKAIGALGAGQR